MIAPPEAADSAPEVRRGWIRRMGTYLRPHRRSVGIAFTAAVVGTTIAAFSPLVERTVVDNGIVAHHGEVTGWLVVLVLFGITRFFAAYARRYWGGRVSLDVQHDLRTDIFRQLQRLDFARHDELQTGQLVSRASSDVALIQGLLAFLPIGIGNIVMFVVSIVLMLWLSPLLTLIMLVVSPLLLFTAIKLRTSIFPASWDAQQKAGEVATVVEESVTGVRVVKGFGQEQQELDRLVADARRLYGSRTRLVRTQARLQPALQTIPALAQVAVLALGGWLALEGRISIGTFYAFMAYVSNLVSPVRMLAGILTVGQLARAGAERIFDLLDSNPVVTERDDATELTTGRGEIAFDGVSFGYLRSEPVLRDFSLRVQPGETVALVGASGSGKSTVALLLPRFYDVQGGSVSIGGTDIRDVTLASLRRHIGVVFEDSFLFSDTVRANIAFGRPEATDDDIVAAARAAEAHAFIPRLPDGYDTVVGEQGLTLSGGQRQRVALARALLSRPEILLLDDATSAVDARVEEEIHATLSRLLAGHTTILIAHRRSTLNLADRIVVVEDGRVVDSGPQDELWERCSLFRKLLSGPGEDAEGVDADDELPEPDALEMLGDDAITASAWQVREEEDARLASAPATPARPLAFGGGGGGGGGFGGGGAAMALAPTPELLAQVDALPPTNDDPGVDVSGETRTGERFVLRRFLRPYRAALLFGVLLVALDGIATLLGPALVKLGLDRGVATGSTAALMAASGAFLVVTLLDWLDMWAETVVTGKTAERLLFALRVKIFAQLQRLGIDYYEHEMAGRIMTRMTTDVDALSQLLQNGLVNALVNIVSFVGVGVALAIMNPQLAGVTAIALPPLVIATLWFRRASGRAYDKARDRIAAVNANLQEGLSGVRVSQAFSQEGRSSREFEEVARGYLDARLRAQQLVATYFPFVEMLSELTAALVLGAGAALLPAGARSGAEVITFLLYLDLFFTPIQQLSQVFDSYQQARVSMGRIGELLDTPTSLPPPADPVVPGRLRGEIHFDHVRFRYPTTVDDALRDLDLRVTPGESVALVGETGAGKSTIVKLVARFYDPSDGRVLVDGVPVDRYDPAAYHAQLGIVPQEPFLFSGTIRDNIAYGRREATDADVEAAARAVGAHAFVAALPNGYLQHVSERGRSLSAGQRQLIALARARLVDPAILLLDEATSNLDLATEAAVTAAMGIAAQGRTTLLIAHRLQTARSADRIVVIDDGRAVEQGTHDELLRHEGRYAAMWAASAPEPHAV
ncbi:MAG TPA: ABC transporter ATP-binding protein [Acidimicrobiia bacterium]